MTVSSVNVESSADFKTILESAGAGIVQVDQRGRICYSNRRAAKILGYSRAELNNRDFHSLVRCRGIRTETDLIDRCPLQDFLQGESSLDESLRLLTRKDGRSVAVEMTLAAVSEGHKRVGAVISLKDISRHANEQEVIAGSESRYRNFIQKFEGIAFRTTLDLKPIFFHGAIEEITGYSEKEFISQDLSWDQIIYPDDYNIFLERTRYVLMVPDAGRELQYRIVRKDGQIRWIAEYVQKVCDDEGQPLFVQGTMYDISDRKRAEMELREREKQLAEAQRIARMGNWMWDIKSGKVSWSDEVYRIFGCKPREFEPTLDRVQETIFEEDRQRLIETVENSIALNKAASLDHRILLPDGNTRTVHSQGEVIRDDDGRPVRMVGTIQDISERVEAEQEIRKLNEELEKRVAERTSKLMEEIEGREGIETALLDEKEKVQSILDNAGQGFLTFGRSLKIDLEYSEKCRTLFGGEIWGNTFPDLIYPNDEEQHEFLETILADIFSEIDHEKREIFISLLPQEVHVNKRIAHIEYKDFITPAENDEQKLLVVITDITENRELQDRIEKERNVLKMVVKAVTNYTELSESMRDYEIFVNAQMEMILDGEGPVDEMIDEIFRAFHTFKGTFSQLELINVVEKLHAL
ncbi:MAG: PAS domain S-box protein, partial [candidate division Zixibacteria bacterium]|nr:PAS domain S-box protein [candidate division Zixibacteria bacterium]